jgi:type IV secretory pathway VirB2 component (pilin)
VKLSLSIALSLLLVCALVATGHASPIHEVTSVFDDALDLFLNKIVPGLAIAVLAWAGVMIAMGRKSLVDSVVVIAGAALALFASQIIDAMRASGK